MLLDHCYVFGLLLQPFGLKKFIEEEDPRDIFSPVLDPPQGGSGRKTTTLVRDHEYFVPTKFNQNSSSDSEKSRKYKKFMTDGRTTDGAL